MDFSNLIDSGVNFFREQTLWAVVIALLIGGLIYWKPKGMFKLAMAALALAAIIYVFTFLVDLTSQGISGTKKFTDTPEQKVE